MYNTTTIPTVILNNGPTIFHALLSGFIIVMPFFAGIFHLVRRYDEEHRSDGEEDSDEDEEENDEEEGQYIEEFKALSDRELTDKDFKELDTKMVKETIDTTDDTKKVDIIMSYHKDSESFWYYTNDLKEIAYKTLESVARKFVIEHNCKRLYVQAQEEQHDKETTAQDEPQSNPQEGGAGGLPPRSVFAKFKKYNTGTKGGLPNFSSDTKPPTEQGNHFRYKGKLYHYEETFKEKDKDNLPTTLLDYAAYKLLMQANKKEN